MSALTVLYALLFYVAAAMLVGGVAYKCWVYARTPQPLKIPIPPAPTTRRGVVLRMLMRGHALPEPVPLQQVDLALRLDLSRRAAGGAPAPSALFHRAGLDVGGADPAVRPVRRIRDARRSRGPLGAALPGRPRALHQRSLRSPDAGTARCDRRERTRDEIRRAHRHRRAQGVLSRPDARSTGRHCLPTRCCSFTLRWSRR